MSHVNAYGLIRGLQFSGFIFQVRALAHALHHSH